MRTVRRESASCKEKSLSNKKESPAISSGHQALPYEAMKRAVRAANTKAPAADGYHGKVPPEVVARIAVMSSEQGAAALAARADRASQRMSKARPAHAALLSRILAGKRKTREALLDLRKMADEIGRAAAGSVACAKGCSHCCHIPVAVSQREADIIGSEIGRAAARLSGIFRPSDEAASYRNPCPFLVSGSCGIYASRPIACRLQFSVDVDDLLCRLIDGQAVPVPLLDVTDYQMAYAVAMQDQAVADIRDFFPDA